MLKTNRLNTDVIERRRVLFAVQTCYLDDSNGASVASRAMMEALARAGFEVEAISGATLEHHQGIAHSEWLSERGFMYRSSDEIAWTVDALGSRPTAVPHYRLESGHVPLTLHRGAPSLSHEDVNASHCEFLTLYENVIDRFQPDTVVTYGGDEVSHRVRSMARERGAAVVFVLHNFNYTFPEMFKTVDAVIVPSQFAAVHYRKTLGLHCTPLSNLVDAQRVRAESHDPQYVTFVNPSYEKGVFVFARIAEELGRRRPDIPLLVVEGRGSEHTLVNCGLDLRDSGNVSLMSHTSDPRQFWSVTRVCLVPSLWWENQPLVAVEALVNGIPVIGSDRGGIPEVLGNSGVVLPLPDRLTAATRLLPTAEEVTAWVEAVIRLWGDQEFYNMHRERALHESQRWAPEVLEPQIAHFFNNFRVGEKPVLDIPMPGNVTAIVPDGMEASPEFEYELKRLEEAGVLVNRGGADIEVSRNTLVSDALHDGKDAVLILSPEIRFQSSDAIRLLARPEPVIAGICATSGDLKDGVAFAPGVSGVRLGAITLGMYPLEYAGAEFLRIRTDSLRRMVEELGLPLCNTDRGRGVWPFFHPTIVSSNDGSSRYLGAVEAFYFRLRQVGITSLADTTIRLDPIGRSSPWARVATCWQEIPGMFDFEAVYDAAVDAATDGSIFVEVGCLAGRSTCYLGERIRKSGKAITLYAIDTGQGSASDSTGQMIAPAVGGSLAGVLHRNLIGCRVDEIVVPIFTTSTRAARLFPPNTVDFCFIDADHSYESVSADLRAWWPIVKPGGMLAGHDYLQSSPWLLGVTPAVHNFFNVPNASHPACTSCWSATKPFDRAEAEVRPGGGH